MEIKVLWVTQNNLPQFILRRPPFISIYNPPDWFQGVRKELEFSHQTVRRGLDLQLWAERQASHCLRDHIHEMGLVPCSLTGLSVGLNEMRHVLVSSRRVVIMEMVSSS